MPVPHSFRSSRDNVWERVRARHPFRSQCECAPIVQLTHTTAVAPPPTTTPAIAAAAAAEKRANTNGTQPTSCRRRKETKRESARLHAHTSKDVPQSQMEAMPTKGDYRKLLCDEHVCTQTNNSRTMTKCKRGEECANVQKRRPSSVEWIQKILKNLAQSSSFVLNIVGYQACLSF